AWTISASTYGARFQNFCDRRLHLTVGTVFPRELEWGKGYELKPPSGQFEWRDEIEEVAKGIVAGIWTWINSLPSGSEILSRAEAVVDIALSHAAIIERILSNTNFKDEFNPVERSLVKLFLMFNPGVAASASLHRLEVTPDPHAEEATPTRRNLHFPFGLAIT